MKQIFAVCVFVSLLITSQQVRAEKCSGAHTEGAKRQTTAIQEFKQYFEGLKEILVEREEILDLTEVALLAKEHVLFMGPPGNAKSMISDLVLGNIVHETDQSRSYYRIQMTPETTMSETHGPISPKDIFDSGKIIRHYDQGMLNSKNVFIDEIFDARANAQRNILGLLAERQHAQGNEIVEGKIETVLAATNRYLDEVYDRAGDQGPKALLDRFSFNVYVPGEFLHAESYNRLIKSAKSQGQKKPQLTFEKLDELRALVPQVEIPDSMVRFLALVSYRMKTQTETMEQGSLKAYRKKVQNGENPPPPYRATKYHSPRTLFKAAGILKAFVVQDFIRTGGQRDLVATVEDVKKLKSFFTLNGPAESFINEMLERTSNPYERSQLSNILQESKIYEETFAEVAREMNEVVYQYALADIAGQMTSGMTTAAKSRLASELMGKWLETATRTSPTSQSEQTGQEIGYRVVTEYLESQLRQLIPADRFETEIAKKKKEIEEEKIRIEKEAREKREAAERARIAKEQEERRLAKLEERRKKRDEYLARFLPEALKDVKNSMEDLTETTTDNYSKSAKVQGSRELGQFKFGGDEYLMLPGQHGLIFKADGKVEKFEYDQYVKDYALREAFRGNEKEIFMLSNDRAAVRVGNRIYKFDIKTWTIVGHAEITDPKHAAIDYDRKVLIEGLPTENAIRKIDLDTGTVSRVNAEDVYHYLQNMTDQDFAFVDKNGRYGVTLNSGNSFVVFTGNGHPTNHNPNNSFRAAATAIHPDTFYGVTSSSQRTYVQTIDLLAGTNAERTEFDIAGVNDVTTGLSVSPDGSRAAVTRDGRIFLIDLKTKTFVGEFVTPWAPQSTLGLILLNNTHYVLKTLGQDGLIHYNVLRLKTPTEEEINRAIGD